MDTSRASRRAVLAGAVLGCLLAASAVLPAPEEPPASQPSGPQASQPAGAEELQRQIEALAKKMEEAARRGDLRELQRLNEDATALSRRLMQLYSQPAGPQPGAPGASLAAGALTRTFAVKVKASQRTQRTVPSHDASGGQGSCGAYQHDFCYTAEQK